MRPQTSRSPSSSLMPLSSTSLASSRSPSPPKMTPLGRRQLWSPPQRRKTSPTDSPSKARTAARSTTPRQASLPRLQLSVAAITRVRLPSQSRRLGHRTQHDSRPPATTPVSSDDENARERRQRRDRTPTPSSALRPPSSPPTPSPPQTPSPVRHHPPVTRSGNRGSRSVASTLVASARKRVQARPLTPDNIQRVNRKLSALAL